MEQSVQLSTAVAGVQFRFHRRGRPLGGLILAEALECALGAHSAPESWLETFHAHQRLIVLAALRRYRSRPEQVVVLRSADV